MKFRIIRDCMIKGQHAKVGEIVDVDDSVGTTLLAIGRVEPYTEEKMENRSVGLENSSEEPKKRGRPRKVTEEESSDEESSDEEESSDDD